MKKFVNGKYVELTEEEIAEMQTQNKEHTYQEQIRPLTLEESLLALNRSIALERVAQNDDKTEGIACMALFEPWTRGAYEVGDIRTSPTNGYPYECILAHDSKVNTDWTIDVRTLWKPYHSRKKEYALPFEAPTGTHDMYKKGEYMIFTDKEFYVCLSDTAYSPTEYADAWEKIE